MLANSQYFVFHQSNNPGQDPLYWYFVISIVIQSPSSLSFPIMILDVNNIIPSNIFTNLSEANFDQITDDLLMISWDFGTVINNNNNSNVVFTTQLFFTAIILDTGVSGTTMQFSASSFSSGLMISSTQLSAITLVPILVIEGSVSVSA